MFQTFISPQLYVTGFAKTWHINPARTEIHFIMKATL